MYWLTMSEVISSRSQLDLEDSMFSSDLGLPQDTFDHQSPTQHSPQKTAQQSPDAFARSLTRLQEEQIMFVKKIEKEKRRREQLDADVEGIKQMLRAIQDKTHNGNIVRQHDVMHKKLIARLEYQLQTSKVKLSVAKNENAQCKSKIEDLRREKMLQLQILSDLIKETSSSKRRVKFCSKEVTQLNEKKNKLKLMISSVKQKMIRDMEDFSRELQLAKQNISNTQNAILHTIRDKLNMPSLADYEPPSSLSPIQK
ncbi:hypothetical protein EON64_15295, partial [archaeon]